MTSDPRFRDLVAALGMLFILFAYERHTLTGVVAHVVEIVAVMACIVLVAILMDYV